MISEDDIKTQFHTFLERTITMSRDVSVIQFNTMTEKRKMTLEELSIVKNWRNEWIHQLRGLLDIVEQDADFSIQTKYSLLEMLPGLIGVVVGLEQVIMIDGEQQTPVVQWPTIPDSEGTPEISGDGGSTPPGSIKSNNFPNEEVNLEE